MKTITWILIGVGALAVCYIIFRRKRDHYTTPNGSWTIQWTAPTGTQPITYLYTVTDTGTGNQIVGASTTDTSITLDPALFVPDPNGGVMSDKVYKATITPTNPWGDGDDDTFQFSIADTPAIRILQNFDEDET